MHQGSGGRLNGFLRAAGLSCGGLSVCDSLASVPVDGDGIWVPGEEVVEVLRRQRLWKWIDIVHTAEVAVETSETGEVPGDRPAVDTQQRADFSAAAGSRLPAEIGGRPTESTPWENRVRRISS